jgi:hypothetical protein
VDAYQYHFQLAHGIQTKATNTSMLLQFGDAKGTTAFLNTNYPLVIKAHLADKLYQDRFGQPSPLCNQQQQHHHHPPILGLYMVHRHYNHFDEVGQLWDVLPWSTKQDTLLWQGASPGK